MQLARTVRKIAIRKSSQMEIISLKQRLLRKGLKCTNKSKLVAILSYAVSTYEKRQRFPVSILSLKKNEQNWPFSQLPLKWGKKLAAAPCTVDSRILLHCKQRLVKKLIKNIHDIALCYKWNFRVTAQYRLTTSVIREISLVSCL